jgi:hypothetical protein
LYDKRITKVSSDTLESFLSLIEFPICLLGGWAVYFTVNDYLKGEKQRDYLGSKDIDFGFSLKPMMGKTELKSTNLFKFIGILEKKGYKPSMFGYKKDFYYKDIGYSKDEIGKDAFTLYVDILVNSYPPSYQEIFRYNFFEIPFIEEIYKNIEYQVKLPTISDNLFIPIREILTAMKIQSIPTRVENHKIIKDLCDLYGLVWYCDNSAHKIIEGALCFINTDLLKNLKDKITDKIIKESENYLGEPEGSINTVLNEIFKNI